MMEDNRASIDALFFQWGRMTMAMTEAQKRACNKYQKTLGQISIRLSKPELERYKAAAEKEGMTFRSWVISAMERRVVKI